jgi:hypothetical protein
MSLLSIRFVPLLVIAFACLMTTRAFGESFVQANSNDFSWGASSHGFAVSLTFSKLTFDPTEPIVAVLGLRNLNSNPVEIARGAIFVDFDWVVLDGAGRQLQPRDDKPAPGFESSGPIGISLGPRFAWRESFDLRERFKFPPGTYTITITRPIQLEADIARIGTNAPPIAAPMSQTVTIHVLP